MPQLSPQLLAPRPLAARAAAGLRRPAASATAAHATARGPHPALGVRLPAASPLPQRSPAERRCREPRSRVGPEDAGQPPMPVPASCCPGCAPKTRLLHAPCCARESAACTGSGLRRLDAGLLGAAANCRPVDRPCSVASPGLLPAHGAQACLTWWRRRPAGPSHAAPYEPVQQ